MSVIIRLQNLPWSANALDIRNFFRGLSIPEGGVHIVGGELGDAFIAFSTDEDARQAMMLDCGKIKEIQVKLLLSSRSEMHKVIETARQSVPILSLTAPAAAPSPVATIPVPVTTVPAPVIPTPPVITPFSAALGNTPLSSFGIPGIGNPQEIPQPAVIEPPIPLSSPPIITTEDTERDEEKQERKRSKEKDKRRSRTRSRSRSRERDRDRNKERKRDRRDRSRSRERRRRDRSRSRERRDRKRDRKDRSRSRDRSPSRRSRDRRNIDRKSPNGQDNQIGDGPTAPPPPTFINTMMNIPPKIQNIPPPLLPNGPPPLRVDIAQNRFNDPSMADAINKLQELGKKRNPNAFQGEQQNGAGRFQGGRGGTNATRGGGNFRREGRGSRFDNEIQRDCCVAIRNAPNHTSYGDVRRFFPFMIDKHGIKMINDNMGRRTGNIFVRFCDARSKQLALQRRNNELKGAQVTVEPLEDEAYETAVDSFLPYREENDEEDQSLVIADPEETPIPQFSVLKLSDLPNFVKEHDIIKAFSEFSLLSIMLNDCRISRSKIAFVQFVKTEDARLALERKDKYIFGRRHPTIVSISDEEYDKEKLMLNEKPSEPHLIQNNQHVVEPPTEIRPEPIVPRDPRQRRQQIENGSGAKSVPPAQQPPPFFPTPFGQSQFTAQPFPNTQFGGYPGPGNALDPRTAAANWANRPTFPNPPPATAPIHNQNVIEIDDEPLDCVLMKGLPSNATDRTIVSFLSGTGAVPARIHLMLDQNGLPSGDCFCEFRTNHEARMAVTKHGHNLEGCRITIDIVSRSVVEEALDGPKQPDLRPDMRHPDLRQPDLRQPDLRQPDVRDSLLGNAPHFFDSGRGGFKPRGTFRGRGGYDRGFDRSGFRGGFDNSRGFRGRGGYNDRGRGFDRGRGRGFGRGRGGFDLNGRVRDNLEEDQDPAPPEDFGAPGCVVSMENVPFRATVDDILTFLSEFDLTEDDVIRRYNERGQPTGDARVAFRTPFDAQRAVKTRHMDTILDRRISLTIL